MLRNLPSTDARKYKTIRVVVLPFFFRSQLDQIVDYTVGQFLEKYAQRAEQCGLSLADLSALADFAKQALPDCGDPLQTFTGAEVRHLIEILTQSCTELLDEKLEQHIKETG